MSQGHAWRLQLSGRRPPLNLNDRDHWAARAKITKRIRAEVASRARSLGLPTGLEHVHTQLIWLAPDARRRDEDNLVATAKPAWDGLVDYGLVPDDQPLYMTKHMPRIVSHPDRGSSRLDLWVWVGPRSVTAAEAIVRSWKQPPIR